jgi:hypothetical protein
VGNNWPKTDKAPTQGISDLSDAVRCLDPGCPLIAVPLVTRADLSGSAAAKNCSRSLRTVPRAPGWPQRERLRLCACVDPDPTFTGPFKCLEQGALHRRIHEVIRGSRRALREREPTFAIVLAA